MAKLNYSTLIWWISYFVMCCSIASYMTARFSSECFTAYTFL